MKKSLFSIFALMAMLVAFTSCEKNEVENTATVDMAGEWHVHVTAMDPSTGEAVDEDWFGDGYYNIATSNTAANVATEMWLVDAVCTYFPYQVKIKVDPASMTFSATDAENLYGEGDYGGATVTITNGKIVKNGTTTPSGQPADYIEFFVSFSDDPFPPYYGVAPAYKISGFRYTGFTEDE
ncbi:MAG: hypothetical protein IKX39_07990 [Muribaculaceae bacterium]|nr:hypothetical protein [Muribaculaceae bacterium]